MSLMTIQEIFVFHFNEHKIVVNGHTVCGETLEEPMGNQKTIDTMVNNTMTKKSSNSPQNITQTI